MHFILTDAYTTEAIIALRPIKTVHNFKFPNMAFRSCFRHKIGIAHESLPRPM